MRLLVPVTLRAATRHVALLGKEHQHEPHPSLQQVGGIWEGGIGDMGSRSGHTLHAGREAAAGVGARRAIKQAAHACRSRRRRLLIGTGVSPPAGHMERGTREASSNCA